jgi:hypothetical protein
VAALAAEAALLETAERGRGIGDQSPVETGRVALTGTGEALLNDPEVARLYLGASTRASVIATAAV